MIFCVSGFLDMLTKAQCYRVDDQRGLLTKDQLEIPQFLQLPSGQGQDTEPNEPSTSNSSTADSKEEDVKEDKTSLASSSTGAAEETPDSAGKDLRETAV